jgi:sarcosine oxidase gamma subunit
MLRIDRSHALAVLRVGGSLAPWLLAQLSALDFFALVTANENACTQARISHARVIVITRSAVDPHGPGFELLVDRSLARDLWERLLAAAPHAARMSQLAGA